MTSRTHITANPSFQSWFGNSKVLDKDGRPRVVYHGTASDFHTFDQHKTGENYPTKGACKGFFFISTPETASVYAEFPAFADFEPGLTPEFGDGTANIMPVYLSLKNPLIVKTSQSSPDWYFDRNCKRLYARAQKAGADGIIVHAGMRTIYVAFHPEQVKSAIGNRGTFDPSDPCILR